MHVEKEMAKLCYFGQSKGRDISCGNGGIWPGKCRNERYLSGHISNSETKNVFVGGVKEFKVPKNGGV